MTPPAGPTKKRLFVIMPFGNKRALPTFPDHAGPTHCSFDQWFEHIIKPAATTAGFEAVRADEQLSPGAIMTQVVAGIRDADAILAFLTGLNSNVFYELGWTHALKKPALLLVDKKQHVPFDITHLRVLQYDDTDVDKVAIYVPEVARRLTAIRDNPSASILTFP